MLCLLWFGYYFAQAVTVLFKKGPSSNIFYEYVGKILVVGVIVGFITQQLRKKHQKTMKLQEEADKKAQ